MSGSAPGAAARMSPGMPGAPAGPSAFGPGPAPFPPGGPGAPGGAGGSGGPREPGYSSPWFAPERPATGAFSAPTPPPPAPAPDLDDDDDLDGLPRRVPQASMAPQLRQRNEDQEVSSRSPEELKGLMASMQRGWQEGRSLVEQGGGQTEQERPRPEQGHDVWNRKDGDSDVRPQN
jgi:hypothetical protein